MKKLNNYITERLKLTSKTYNYTCQPKNRNELRKILEERLTKDKNADLNDIDVSQITDMGPSGAYNVGLFEGLNPHDIDISKWNVSNVTNMQYMFYQCKNFTGTGLENWDVSNVTDMSYMFCYCNNFTGKGLENWNVSKVTNMYAMFSRCENFNGDLSKWDVSSVGNMDFMFKNCPNLKAFPKWYRR